MGTLVNDPADCQTLGRFTRLWQKGRMGLSRRGLVARTFTLVCFAGLLVPLVGAADSATEARYPFDPACPWGRIANGKGMITRCISEVEARGLITPRPAPVAAKPTPATPAGSAPVAAAPTAAAPVAVT